MKNKDILLGIYILILSVVPISGFLSLLFLPGSKDIIVIWTFLIIATILSILSFKRQKFIATLSIIILLGTAGLIIFAAMMAGMSPNS
ncbi:hypothetical protein N781_15985 [Pontibacillus halophilus JSM 076056 = DSM 19796]|uniref:Uncharacterized protein n=1 Tax=Pontibacillus halophilus JSM 076056 = DSM 19796 TaxID=1385510 RepID=A0A0A5G9B5_9BACI|nr:hypothetical protein N781_15985 [Pontibacillus halophilus JSM 076056 = DSM 19796]